MHISRYIRAINACNLSQSTINLDNFFVPPILRLKLKLAVRNTFASPRQYVHENKRRRLLTPQDDRTKLTDTSE